MLGSQSSHAASKSVFGAIYLYIWALHNIPQDSASFLAPFKEPIVCFLSPPSRDIAKSVKRVLHRNSPFMADAKFMLPIENRIVQIYNQVALFKTAT